MRTVLQGGSYVQCCQHTHTHIHTVLNNVFMHLPSVQSLFQWLISCSHLPNFETALHLCPSIAYTRALFHVTYMALRCSAHLLPNWCLLFKLSILCSVFMRFKYCVAACMELLENFG